MSKAEIQKLKRRIERLEREKRALQKIAKFDFLTGFYNKKELFFVLKRIIGSQRVKNKRMTRPKISSTLVLVDLDHFKAINDCYGHDIGDQLLMKIADFFKNNLRFSDLLFRYGGEEFAIIFYGLKAKIAYQVCERLRSSLSQQTFFCRPHRLKITASFGVYALQDKNSPSQAIQRADKALYRAKKSRNKTVIYQ